MLIENWEMSCSGYGTMSCKAPCSLYSVLLEHKLIEDPYYGLNDRKITELSDKNCSFKAEFTVDKSLLENNYIELEFLGLDTICSIFLNDALIAKTCNMHRRYVYNIKERLAEGTNTLRLDFSSPTQYFREMNNKHYLYSSSDIKGSAHLRKALFMSGWDWGPQMPDMGIFRPVKINAYNTDRIEDVQVLQYHDNNEVEIEINVETKQNSECMIYAEIDSQKICLEKGKGRVTIKNPRLWWIRGFGEQYLYDLKIWIENDGKVIDSVNKKIGLRTLTMSTERYSDESGEFCFVINGVKIFTMGANYVPQDIILSKVTPESTEELIKLAVDANFNCLRVWGGGYYPEDEFFDLCDKYGIAVWQDFMLACANVWLRKEFLHEITEEAVYNMKRIRNHASLALLCGNNEMEEAVCNWKGVGDSQLVRMDYIELYERIFPALVDEYAPQTFYWPSSPSSGGGFIEPTCNTIGDVHYWKVWHENIPFDEYRKHHFRFCSEYGFESYPSVKTISSFCEKQDMNCFSRVIENHQRCKDGNKKILMYVADMYLYPYSLEELVYVSQLLQADAIRCGVEHFRRDRGYCMGSIYWQFNDCWPVVSWSSVDCFGRCKALHYAAKRFYAPVSLGMFYDNNILTINISNETMEDFNGKAVIVHCDSEFNIIKRYEIEADVSKLTAKDVFSNEIISDNLYNEFVYVDLFDDKNNFVMRNTQLFTVPKFFEWKKPNIKIDFGNTDDGVEMSVSSDVFAKSVCIDFDGFDCVLSDNYFDLTNKEKYIIRVQTEHSAEELKNAVRVMSVYDVGR